jgi:uracil-DNA glycosylase
MSGQLEALSALDWWREAGVDTLVDEDARDWLQAPASTRPAAAPESAANALPETLAGFHAWLRESDAVPGAAAARILPAGNPASGLMLLADMPEPADAAAGSLFAGDIGRLLDRMLAAIGRDRASIYLASMAPVRLPARELETPEMMRMARHHVALAAPRLLLLLGNAPSRAIVGMDFSQARGRLHAFSHDAGTSTTIATFHPRLLLQQPARKADAWADLLMLLAELSR